MKTVIDAVNEFKGIRPSNLINRNGWAYAWKGESPLDAYKFKGRLVCTFEQFNTIVQECMTNFGSSVTYDEYKDSCKARMESPLDDDSHQAKVNNIGNVLHNMSCSMDDENEQNEFGNYASYLWDLAGYFRNQTCYSVPQPKESNMKPVFTQEMSDNGELPPIGSECLVIGEKEIDDEYHECEIIAHRNVSGDVFVAVFMIKNYNGKPYYYTHCSHQYFKPIDTRTDK